MTRRSATKETVVAGGSGRHAPLAMDAATFRSLGHRLVDQVAGFLESLPLGPVTRDESPSAVREAQPHRSAPGIGNGSWAAAGTDPAVVRSFPL